MPRSSLERLGPAGHGHDPKAVLHQEIPVEQARELLVIHQEDHGGTRYPQPRYHSSR